MGYVIVIKGIMGPLNLFVCMLCLTFLFFESVFGICIGCWFYNTFTNKKTELCAGGVCISKRKHEIQKVSYVQIIALALFVALIIAIAFSGVFAEQISNSVSSDCIVPQWAKDIGHEELYALHHGCG